MRLRETPVPIHDSLPTYASQQKHGPSISKCEVVLLAALSAFFQPCSSLHAQIAQRPAPVTSVEQCDDNQKKGTSTIASPRDGANSAATTVTARAVSSDEGSTVIKDRLRLPGISSDARPGEPQQTQCTTDEDQGAQTTPATSKTPARTPVTSAPTASAVPTPLVKYSNGILTINAHNESLREVLDAVRSQTGASVSFPQGGAGDRVFGTFGPGPMRETLVALLDGSAFNYVMLASSSDSRVVRQLILMPRQGTADAPHDNQVAAQVTPAGPGLYGQGFEADQAESSESPEVPVQSAQPTIPPVEANKLMKEAQELQQANPNMTRGQVLSEMQKRHSQQLDDATASQPAVQQ